MLDAISDFVLLHSHAKLRLLVLAMRHGTCVALLRCATCPASLDDRGVCSQCPFELT